MEQWDWLVKAVMNYGALGSCCWLLWSLIDKWAGRFLAALAEQTKATSAQAVATAALATGVKEGLETGREVLMAVRLLADRIERQHSYLQRMDDRLNQQEDLRRMA